MEWAAKNPEERWSGSPASPQCGRRTKVSTADRMSHVCDQTDSALQLTEPFGSSPRVQRRHVRIHVVDPVGIGFSHCLRRFHHVTAHQ